MIHQTGFWHKESAEPHHIHSPSTSAWICKFLAGKEDHQIYDFGCGMGNYLLDLHNNGFTKLLGIEADPPKTDYEFNISSQNLALPFLLDTKGIVICLEVGEHLPQEYQGTFLDNLSNNCTDYLIMSWAIRGQGGYGHYNELNNDEIIPEILKRGFAYMSKESQDLRGVAEDFCAYFRNTLMIFKKL